MEENKLEIIVRKNGELTISDEIGEILEQIDSQKEEIQQHESELRHAILDAMTSNQIYSAKTGKFTISQVIPKNIVEFDTDNFMLNENENIVAAMSNIDETESIDYETLIKENPELIKKYTVKTQTVNVDTNRLKDVFPEIYKKYAHEIQSDKPITLRIAKSKKGDK